MRTCEAASGLPAWGTVLPSPCIQGSRTTQTDRNATGYPADVWRGGLLQEVWHAEAKPRTARRAQLPDFHATPDRIGPN